MENRVRMLVCKKLLKALKGETLQPCKVSPCSRKGFTLIELLVVIAIIGVLTSLLTANFIGVKQRASDGRKKGDLLQIKSALEVYRSDQAGYPTTLPECGSPLKDPSKNVTYMQKIPCESTGVSYQYSTDSVIYCLRTCLENKQDGERDQPDQPNDDPPITGCTFFRQCRPDKVSFTLQNP